MSLNTVTLYSCSISIQSVLQKIIHLMWSGSAEAEGCCSYIPITAVSQTYVSRAFSNKLGQWGPLHQSFSLDTVNRMLLYYSYCTLCSSVITNVCFPSPQRLHIAQRKSLFKGFKLLKGRPPSESYHCFG